ncbi:putative membrane protein [Sphaerotilus hippei]|uniref:Putative membrane protein n=1 Tax=Sphaerotilus hippei TaxID=744406 RepID=A0A318H488_9BURK|nr:CopD family protein [Sphaerotilus hippei]PXW97941.1 putative membrane protein [Sphaerotilus hippei]
MLVSHAIALSIHLLAATYWVGGMAVMHTVVRPAAARTLAPPLRLPFMAGALERFFRGVTVAIAALVFSGLALLHLRGQGAQLHWGLDTMLAIAGLMIAIFVRLRLVMFPLLRAAVDRGDWPRAADELARIRRLVLVNLGLGSLVYLVVLIGRVL